MVSPTPTTTVRLDENTRAQIAELADAYRNPLGKPLSTSDVIRLAVAELARGRSRKKKKSRDSP